MQHRKIDEEKQHDLQPAVLSQQRSNTVIHQSAVLLLSINGSVWLHKVYVITELPMSTIHSLQIQSISKERDSFSSRCFSVMKSIHSLVQADRLGEQK